MTNNNILESSKWMLRWCIMSVSSVHVHKIWTTHLSTNGDDILLHSFLQLCVMEWEVLASNGPKCILEHMTSPDWNSDFLRQNILREESDYLLQCLWRVLELSWTAISEYCWSAEPSAHHVRINTRVWALEACMHINTHTCTSSKHMW